MSMRSETRSKRLTVYSFLTSRRRTTASHTALSTLIQAGTMDYTIWRSWHAIVFYQPCFYRCFGLGTLFSDILATQSAYLKQQLIWIISQDYESVYQDVGWDNDSGKWSWAGCANVIVEDDDDGVLYFSPQSIAFVVSTPLTTCQDHQDNPFTSTASAHSSVLPDVLVKDMSVAHVQYFICIYRSQLSTMIELGFS